MEDAQKLVPKNRVYAVRVTTAGDGPVRAWNGMLNIGCRPTLGEGNAPTVEVFLLDFEGDLYGSVLTLAFVSRLRDEKKFRNKGELAHQLREDEERVRLLFAENKGL